jgi:hypothetical protein
MFVPRDRILATEKAIFIYQKHGTESHQEAPLEKEAFNRRDGDGKYLAGSAIQVQGVCCGLSNDCVHGV